MNKQTTVLVTGASGFVGRHLVSHFAERGYNIVAASRRPFPFRYPNVTPWTIRDLSQPFDWHPLLEKCDVVIHLAGVAHTNADSSLYDLVNRQATETLARAAANRGVHMIFVSSITAQSGSFADHELTETDPPVPDTEYGRSKLAAEQAVRFASPNFTILRPVVIYGAGVKGNFALLNAVARLKIPLPLGALKAQKSILSIENLLSAIELVLNDPRAFGETFIVSNPTPLSVPEIITRTRKELGRASWVFPMPERWIEVALSALGKPSVWHGIARPLVAPPRKLLALGWKPLE